MFTPGLYLCTVDTCTEDENCANCYNNENEDKCEMRNAKCNP